MLELPYRYGGGRRNGASVFLTNYVLEYQTSSRNMCHGPAGAPRGCRFIVKGLWNDKFAGSGCIHYPSASCSTYTIHHLCYWWKGTISVLCGFCLQALMVLGRRNYSVRKHNRCCKFSSGTCNGCKKRVFDVRTRCIWYIRSPAVNNQGAFCSIFF